MNRLKLALIIFVVSGVAATAFANSTEQIVECFVQASASQKGLFNATTTELSASASIPKHKQDGRMQITRNISPDGEVSFQHPQFSPDLSRIIRDYVFIKYLETERDEAKKDHKNLELTPENYKFKLIGQVSVDGRTGTAFAVKPRKKKVGLFKGTLWIDSETCLPLRKEGQFVKTPSMWIKKMKFKQEFTIEGHRANPKTLDTVAETRLVGPAILHVDFGRPLPLQ